MSQFNEISQLVVRERQCRVRHLTDQLGDCFHPDATVTTSWLKGSAATFVSSSDARTGRTREPIINRLGPPLVYESGRRAVVELPSTTVRWIPVNGVEAELASFMRLLYRVEQRGGEWRISDLTAINEGDTLTPAVPGTDLHVDPDAVAELRHSYRFLAYTRSLEGETVNPDLYGIDRPDVVEALYQDAFAWSAQPVEEAGGAGVSTSEQVPTNWGRWGADDERGTLNLITDEVRARAVGEVRSGRSVSLSRPIPTTPLMAGPMAGLPAASTSALQVAMYTGATPRAMAEMLILIPHSPLITHMDSVAHQVIEGQVYPGRQLEDSANATGVQHGSTAVFADGVLTRGVLLDLAPDGALPVGHGVTGADLDAAAHRGGVEVQAGDAIVVRSGWDEAATRNNGMPGMSMDAVRWMHRHDVAVYIGDLGDAHPPIDPKQPGPLHRVGLALLGMPLVDVADPTELARVCAEEGRYSFMFVAAPPRLPAATGVPVNPLAIF